MRYNSLPEGWRTAELGEICRPDRIAITRSDPDYATMAYLGLEHIEPTTGRILVGERDAQESNSKSSNFRFSTDHVLYGKLRPYLNKVALPEFSGRCTTEIIPLMPTSVERSWLAWLLRRQEVVDHAMQGKTGSRMPRASMQGLMTLRVAVPPRNCQARVITELEARIAAADRVRRATDAQLASMAALQRELIRRTFPESLSDPLRPDWRWSKLGDVCEVKKGRTAKRAWYSQNGAWLVRYRDLDLAAHGGVRWSPGRNTFVDITYEADLQRLRPPMILVGADAHDPATIGRKVALVKAIPRRITKAYFAGELLGVRPESRRLSPEIVYHWLRSPAGYREIQKNVSGGHLNVNPARNIWVPIPPRDEQLRLIADLERTASALDRACTAAQHQVRAVDGLSSAAISQAFEP